MQTLKLLGFVGVGHGQGTNMGWDVTVVRQTYKAALIRCVLTGRETWLPKSAAGVASADGARELTTFGVRLVRDAGFRANVDDCSDVI